MKDRAFSVPYFFASSTASSRATCGGTSGR